jgi:hypothetical protein
MSPLKYAQSQIQLDSEMLRASPAVSVGGSNYNNFETPDKKGRDQELQRMATHSHASPTVSEQRGRASASQVPHHASTSSGLQEMQGFSQRWEGLSETIKGQYEWAKSLAPTIFTDALHPPSRFFHAGPCVPLWFDPDNCPVKS